MGRSKEATHETGSAQPCASGNRQGQDREVRIYLHVVAHKICNKRLLLLIRQPLVVFTGIHQAVATFSLPRRTVTDWHLSLLSNTPTLKGNMSPWQFGRYPRRELLPPKTRTYIVADVSRSTFQTGKHSLIPQPAYPSLPLPGPQGSW